MPNGSARPRYADRCQHDSNSGDRASGIRVAIWRTDEHHQPRIHLRGLMPRVLAVDRHVSEEELGLFGVVECLALQRCEDARRVRRVEDVKEDEEPRHDLLRELLVSSRAAVQVLDVSLALGALVDGATALPRNGPLQAAPDQGGEGSQDEWEAGVEDHLVVVVKFEDARKGHHLDKVEGEDAEPADDGVVKVRIRDLEDDAELADDLHGRHQDAQLDLRRGREIGTNVGSDCREIVVRLL